MTDTINRADADYWRTRRACAALMRQWAAEDDAQTIDNTTTDNESETTR